MREDKEREAETVRMSRVFGAEPDERRWWCSHCGQIMTYPPAADGTHTVHVDNGGLIQWDYCGPVVPVDRGEP